MGQALVLQGLDGGQGGEAGIAVVGAPPAVQLAVADDRRPRTEALVPAVHRRLLVQVSVQQHSLLGASGHLDEHQRGAPVEPDHVEAEAGHVLSPHPVNDQLHRAIHMAVAIPVRVIGRRLVRNPQIVGQGRNNPVRPGVFDKLAGGVDVHTFLSLARPD